MNLNDGINFVGQFSIKAFKKDGTVEEYNEKNLIMNEARTNMAQLLGGVTGDPAGEDHKGKPITCFVLGSKGHVGNDVLNYKRVGTEGVVDGNGDVSEFDATRTELFSEGSNDYNYVIPFDATGDNDVTVAVNGTLRQGLNEVVGFGDDEQCTVRRVVDGTTVTYTITIPDGCANDGTQNESIIAYTEAALYCGPGTVVEGQSHGEIFSMKTFPARVKEDTVKFEITWSIIF